MHHRFLYVALTVAAAALVLLGAHRLWERMGSPSVNLDEQAGFDLAGAVMPDRGFLGEEAIDLATLANDLPMHDAPTPNVALTSLHELSHPTLRHRICRHDEALWQAIDAALVSTPANDAIAHALGEASVTGCLLPEREATCSWALSALDQHATERLHVAYSLLAHCDDAHALAWLDREDAPARAVAEFMILREALHDPPLRLPTRLSAAVGEGLTVPFAWSVSAMAESLARYDEDEAQRILLQLHSAAAPDDRESVALAMHYVRDERGQALHREARSPEGGMRCRGMDFASELRSASFDLDFALQRHPERRDEALSLLERCASDADPFVAERCFRRLASLDRTRAALAPIPPRLTLLFDFARFPSRASMETFVESQGIGPVVRLNVPIALPIDALVARSAAFPVSEFREDSAPRTVLALLDAAGLTNSVVEVDAAGLHVYRGGAVIDLHDAMMQPILAIYAFARLEEPATHDALCTFAWADLPYIVCARAPALAALEDAHVFIADTTD